MSIKVSNNFCECPTEKNTWKSSLLMGFLVLIIFSGVNSYNTFGFTPEFILGILDVYILISSDFILYTAEFDLYILIILSILIGSLIAGNNQKCLKSLFSLLIFYVSLFLVFLAINLLYAGNSIHYGLLFQEITSFRGIVFFLSLFGSNFLVALVISNKFKKLNTYNVYKRHKPITSF